MQRCSWDHRNAALSFILPLFTISFSACFSLSAPCSLYCSCLVQTLPLTLEKRSCQRSNRSSRVFVHVQLNESHTCWSFTCLSLICVLALGSAGSHSESGWFCFLLATALSLFQMPWIHFHDTREGFYIPKLIQLALCFHDNRCVEIHPWVTGLYKRCNGFVFKMEYYELYSKYFFR